MALTMGPNTGLLENGDPGEGHYVELMRKWRWADFLAQPVVKGRVATLPTTGLVNGDAYLFIGTGTNQNRIARWTTRLATAQWEYLIPKAGWRIQVNDELDINNQRVTYEFSGTAWSVQLASSVASSVASVDGQTGAVDLSASYEQKRKNNLTATSNPTAANDTTQGYEPLSRWINTSTGELWLCVDASTGAANWQQATLTLDELGAAALADFGNTAGTATEGNDTRLSDARDWTASTVSQAEAEAGTATTRRAFTAQRVRQAVASWWNGASTEFGRSVVAAASAAAGRAVLELGNAATGTTIATPVDNTAGRLLTVGASPTILLFDPLRKAVEAESGGRQTVIYTAKGQPCIMYVLPRFNMEDIPGWDAGTGTHPAFLFNGVAASEIFIGAFQASESQGEAVSQPMKVPRVSINYDASRSLAQANGPGWDVTSIWDWAAIALWCMANGFEPRGNTNHGRHHDNRWETGRRQDNGIPGNSSGIGNILTGSGPNQWRHDNSPAGISDLVGNVWEWQTGFRMVDGRAFISPDNNIVAESAYLDTGFDMPATSSTNWAGLAKNAPDILKQSLIMPKGYADPSGSMWTTLTGERLPYRGGARDNSGHAGLSAMHLSSSRTFSFTDLGFRPRFRNL